MAIIICPECGKEVSDKAPKCIHCGYPLGSTGSTSINDAKKEKKPVNKKLLLGICSGLVIIALLVGMYFSCFTPAARYRRAETAFANGKYEKAITNYEKAGNYEDSIVKLQNSTVMYNYTIGKESLEAEEWAAAKEAFENCINYGDTKELIKECNYNIASQSMLNGAYDEAKEILTELGDYNDSKQKVAECNYNLALALENSGDIYEAAMLYGEAASFNDADERIIAIGDTYLDNEDYYRAKMVYKLSNSIIAASKYNYAEAHLLLDKNDISGAADALSKAGDVFDAKELYISTSYNNAQALLAKGNYSDAMSWFSKVKNYKDADSMQDKCSLMLANEEIEKGNLNTAKKALLSLDSNVSYNGISVADLTELLENNSNWVDICGSWFSTGGEMRVTQNGSYGYYNYWYREFADSEVAIDVRCPIINGIVKVKVKGSIPIFTEYSSISAGLKTSNQKIDYESVVDGTSTFAINDYTSISVSPSQITVDYYKEDNTVDVYFSYVYSTDVVFEYRIGDF